MAETAQQRAYRLSQPVHPDQHRTGAVVLTPDSKDYPAFLEPRIWAGVAAGDFRPTDMLGFVKEPRYNQGNTGACVANSTCGNNTLAHSEADSSWPQYAAQQLYAEAGGTGQNGVDARTVLEICRKQGTPLPTGGREVVVQSYVFVDTAPGMARPQIKAALASGLSVLLACLLPIPFGWNSGTVVSQGYHQIVVVGWMVDSQGVEWYIILNSWGDGWPGDGPAGTPPGVGRLRCDFIESQAEVGFFYAIVPTDLTITPPPPPPPPPPINSARVTATVTGPNVAGLIVGQTLTTSSNLALVLTTVQFDPDPNPNPNPDPKPDPKPDPNPNPNPDPNPGDLVVAGRQEGGLLKAEVHDLAGTRLFAYCNAVVGGIDKGLATTGPTKYAVWLVNRFPAGTTAIITATTTDGRSGGATVTL